MRKQRIHLALGLASLFAAILTPRPCAAQVCTLSCPLTLIIPATGPQTRVDIDVVSNLPANCRGSFSFEMSPPRGSNFPLGTTNVSISGASPSGQTVGCSINVNVVPPTSVPFTISESPQTFPAGSFVRTETSFGPLISYFDSGHGSIQIFNDQTPVGTAMTPTNLVLTDAATTDTGGAFIGYDSQTRLVKLFKVDFVDSSDTSVTTRSNTFSLPLTVGNSTPRIKGNLQGDLCGGVGNTVIVHTSGMADGAFNTFSIPASATLQDFTLAPRACLALTTGANQIVKVSLDGSMPMTMPLQFKGTGVVDGTDGKLLIPDASNPVIHIMDYGFDKTSLTEVGQFTVSAPLTLPFLARGALLGGLQGRALTFTDAYFHVVSSTTLAGTAPIASIKSSASGVIVNEVGSSQSTVSRVLFEEISKEISERFVRKYVEEVFSPVSIIDGRPLR